MKASPSSRTLRSPGASELGCLFAIFFAPAALPFWLGAIFLLFVGATLEGRLFALALIFLLPMPLVFLRASDRKRTLWGWGLGLAGGVALVTCIFRSPSSDDSRGDTAQLLYMNGTSHSRLSPANVVPGKMQSSTRPGSRRPGAAARFSSYPERMTGASRLLICEPKWSA